LILVSVKVRFILVFFVVSFFSGGFLAYAYFTAKTHSCDRQGERILLVIYLFFVCFFFFFVQNQIDFVFDCVLSNTCVVLKNVALVPLWMLFSAITSLVYGGLFLIYSLYACVSHCRHRGYDELNESATLAEAARPSCFFCVTGVLLIVVYLFRFSWLVFGTVEVFGSSECDLYLVRMAFVYIVIQWTLIGGFFLLAVAACCILVCCVTLLTKG
jgi:hypothetical protein